MAKVTRGSLREYMAHLRDKTLISDRAFPKIGPDAHRPLCQSLPGPWNRPTGTDPTPAITPATHTSVVDARARRVQHLQVCAGDGASGAAHDPVLLLQATPCHLTRPISAALTQHV